VPQGERQVPFADAGFAVLPHDHRGFGDSGGEPRNDVNPWQQIADWRRAVSYLQQRPEVDEDRIGLCFTEPSERVMERRPRA
jgi:alpha-beta hydrolase superfamily lysophospholipase